MTLIESNQEQATDDDGGNCCAPASSVPDGVIAPDMMVVNLDSGREPFARAIFPERDERATLQVTLLPNGEHLSDLANALRSIADRLPMLYADFARSRQAHVDTVSAAAGRILSLSKTEWQQVRWALRSARPDDFNDDIPF